MRPQSLLLEVRILVYFMIGWAQFSLHKWVKWYGSMSTSASLLNYIHLHSGLYYNLLDRSEDIISETHKCISFMGYQYTLRSLQWRRFSATEILDTFSRLALNTDEIGNTTGVDPGLFEIYYESIIRSYETLSVAIIFRALRSLNFALRGLTPSVQLLPVTHSSR